MAERATNQYVTHGELEGILTRQTDEFKRYVGVLVEDFTDKQQLLAEAVSHIGAKVTSLDDRMLSLEDKMLSVEDKLTTLEEKVDSHTEMIGQLMEDTQEMRAQLTQGVQRSEFTKLETRVSRLETKLV